MHDSSATRHQDGLRIIAAGAVVILHYSDYFKDVPIGQFMVAHTWHFNLFVDLFFVVSGFVIARQYFGRVDDAASIGRFLWRRLARIYPLPGGVNAHVVLEEASAGAAGPPPQPTLPAVRRA